MKKPGISVEESREITALTSKEESERREPALLPVDDDVTWEEILEEELERQKWLVWEAWRVGLV